MVFVLPEVVISLLILVHREWDCFQDTKAAFFQAELVGEDRCGYTVGKMR